MASQAPLSPSVQRAANRRTFLAQLLKAGGLTAAAPMFAGERSLRAQDENILPLAIEGYFDRMSCLPGEVAGLHVSTSADTYSVQLIRVGAQPKTYWQAKGLAADLYPVPADVAMSGCDWPAALHLPVGKDWPSGLYVARLQGERGQEKSETRDALLIVRSLHPGKQHRILYQVATNTYQAYNEWGGTNLYSGPRFPRVSFDKPFKIYPTPLIPGQQWYNPNTNSYHTWDEPFIVWAERAGYGIDYCANLDLEFHPDELEQYQLVLSVGHDEYWSAGMRDNLEAFIGRGGNVAFLSGNSICWQVRVENQGRELVCYKRAHDHDPAFQAGNFSELTDLWNEPLVGRPENTLSGVGFAYGGYNGLHGEFMGGQGRLLIPGDQPAYIGSYRNGDEFFHGDLDELRIYNRALDTAEIGQLSQGKLAVWNQALTGWWKCDGNLHNYASAGQTQPEPRQHGAPFRYVAGRHGQALRLNGQDQTAEIVSYPGLRPDSNQITIAAWVRPAEAPNTWLIIYRKDDGDGRQLLALGGPEDRHGIWTGLGFDCGYKEVVGKLDRQALLDGHWHHVAATYDGTHIRIYHNGKQLAEERTVEEGAGEYTVHRPDHWILAGTGLRQGDKFGAEDGICGYECDGCEIVWQDGLPIATGRDGTPRDFVVVATGPARWDAPEGTLKWAHDIRKSWPVKPGDLVPDDLEQDGYATVGTYTRNGTVVTVGSCDWSDGLKAGNPTVDRIVRNILNRLLE